VSEREREREREREYSEMILIVRLAAAGVCVREVCVGERCVWGGERERERMGR